MLQYTIIHSNLQLDINFSELHFFGFIRTKYIIEEVETCLKESISEFKKYVFQNEVDKLYKMLESAYPTAYAQGDINYNDVYTLFVSLTKGNIREKYRDSYSEIKAIDSGQNIECAMKILYAEWLIELLNEEKNCGHFDAHLSSYIEEMLEGFIDISTWHHGFNKKNVPILWYGPEGQEPIEKWTISYGHPLSNMWFEEEPWSLLDYLVDECDDCFATWYIDECGASLPNMSAILKECPIAFEENDSVEDINKKMDDYFSGL